MTFRRPLLVALAALALTAPAALAQTQDLRSPDTRDAAAQDFRSPDTRDAATRLRGDAFVVPSVPPPEQPADDGIEPLPVVIAIAAALIVGLGAGSRLHVVRARTSRDRALPLIACKWEHGAATDGA